MNAHIERLAKEIALDPTNWRLQAFAKAIAEDLAGVVEEEITASTWLAHMIRERYK